MDDVLLKQILRQLKLLNVWITVFGTLILISLAVAGVVLYKLVTFANESFQSINNFQAKAEQSLDVKSQLCEGDNASILRQTTKLCE